MYPNSSSRSHPLFIRLVYWIKNKNKMMKGILIFIGAMIAVLSSALLIAQISHFITGIIFALVVSALAAYFLIPKSPEA